MLYVSEEDTFLFLKKSLEIVTLLILLLGISNNSVTLAVNCVLNMLLNEPLL